MLENEAFVSGDFLFCDKFLTSLGPVSTVIYVVRLCSTPTSGEKLFCYENCFDSIKILI